MDQGGACTRFVLPGATSQSDIFFDTLEDDNPENLILTNDDEGSGDGLSRNTGFVSFTHQGTDVPDLVSKLALDVSCTAGSPRKNPHPRKSPEIWLESFFVGTLFYRCLRKVFL